METVNLHQKMYAAGMAGLRAVKRAKLAARVNSFNNFKCFAAEHIDDAIIKAAELDTQEQIEWFNEYVEKCTVRRAHGRFDSSYTEPLNNPLIVEIARAFYDECNLVTAQATDATASNAT